MENLKKNLIKAFDEPITENQRAGIVKFINDYCGVADINKTEFLINLRDYLLDYTLEY